MAVSVLLVILLLLVVIGVVMAVIGENVLSLALESIGSLLAVVSFIAWVILAICTAVV